MEFISGHLKTYQDIYDMVTLGYTVICHNRWGNRRTYFKNNRGEIRQRFNKCKDSYFTSMNTSIDFIDIIKIDII